MSTMTKSLNAWNNFWQPTGKETKLSDIGSQDDSLESFWLQAFKVAIVPSKKTKLLDLASGYGQVIQLANLANRASDCLETHSIDISPSALQQINIQSPNTYTVCANLNAIPYKDASFDIVTSQFGVEYAGLSAISSALRLVNETGKIIWVCHKKNGSIYQECLDNFNQLNLFINSNFVPHFLDAFRLAYSVAEGREKEVVFQAADEKFSISINKLKSQLSVDSKKSQALLLIQKLYSDVAHIYQNMHDFKYSEILIWSDKIHKDMSDYRERMSSMVDSALDETKYKKLLELLHDNDFTINKKRELYFTRSQELPAAWAIIATKM